MEEKNRLETYLSWILDAIEKIHKYLEGINIDELEKYPIIVDACLMQLIHIGETMNKLVKKFPTFEIEKIDTKRVINFRNFVAHDYLGINMPIIKRILGQNLKELKIAIEKYLKN